MHLLDVFKTKQKRRSSFRKPQFLGSIKDELEVWDPWAYSPYTPAVTPFTMHPNASRTLSVRPNETGEDEETWQILNSPRSSHTRSSTNASSPSLLSDDDTISTRSVPVRRHAPAVPVVQRQATSSRLHEEFSSASSTPQIPISPMTISTDDTATVTDVQVPTPVMPGRPIRYRTEHGGGHHGGGGHASGSGSPRPGPTPIHAGRRSPSEQHEREMMSPSFRARASPSPTPSSVSSSIVHTLNNGTRIHVPAAPIEERGRPIVRDPDRKKRSTFYIVPPGMNVIFQDADGNEITRVGDFNMNGPPVEYQEAPIILKDEDGRVIYQTGAENRDDDAEFADRPNVVHLGQFMPEGYRNARSTSPITVSLDQRGREMLIYSDENKKFEARSERDRSRREHRRHRSPSAQSSRAASDISRVTSVGR